MSYEACQVIEGARHWDALCTRDYAIEEAQRTLYFDALTELSRTGELSDPKMHSDLDESVFVVSADSMQPTEVFRLVGELHNLSTLDREGRERAYAAIGKYMAGCVEKHLARLTDAEALRSVA